MRHFIRTIQRLSTQKRGFTLIEVLISTALIALGGVAILQGLSTVARGQGVHDERVGALVAAQAHLESIKQAPYDSSVTSTPGPGYTSLPVERTVDNILFDMQIIAQQIETGVQLVTVVVSNSGSEINRLQTYKVDR